LQQVPGTHPTSTGAQKPKGEAESAQGGVCSSWQDLASLFAALLAAAENFRVASSFNFDRAYGIARTEQGAKGV
jgi:hypothetical protein